LKTNSGVRSGSILTPNYSCAIWDEVVYEVIGENVDPVNRILIFADGVLIWGKGRN
jgi:hypothetical protein